METTFTVVPSAENQLWVGISLTFPMTVVMPCGFTISYNSLDDLPRETVLCPCSNPAHILVKVEQTPPIILEIQVESVG